MYLKVVLGLFIREAFDELNDDNVLERHGEQQGAGPGANTLPGRSRTRSMVDLNVWRIRKLQGSVAEFCSGKYSSYG